ncbi:hypothetical protein PHYPO_G00005590 [Pangasianodon hypophthalmus]|uniref:Uncharacterized protein n=1 Tax=Pangasianodon hypophthalmus TaxID=310915 RepID=A0A5N5Q4C8_PANHP|nr:hypothetical protein PHYPO_G00005590 [Pangasianodon hypophthalmus]
MSYVRGFPKSRPFSATWPAFLGPLSSAAYGNCSFPHNFTFCFSFFFSPHSSLFLLFITRTACKVSYPSAEVCHRLAGSGLFSPKSGEHHRRQANSL